MDKAVDPGFSGDPRQPRRAEIMRPLEGLPAGLGENADAIDDRIAAGEERRQQPLVVDRDIDGCDLADQPKCHQEPRAFGIAAADRHDITASGEPLDDIAADKARPAEHRGSATSHLSPR